MNSTENILARAARHLVDDPHLIAAALATHQAREEVDEAAVADWLGISVERLHGLALCTRPDPHDLIYAAQVDAIAGTSAATRTVSTSSSPASARQHDAKTRPAVYR